MGASLAIGEPREGERERKRERDEGPAERLYRGIEGEEGRGDPDSPTHVVSDDEEGRPRRTTIPDAPGPRRNPR